MKMCTFFTNRYNYAVKVVARWLQFAVDVVACTGNIVKPWRYILDHVD